MAPMNDASGRNKNGIATGEIVSIIVGSLVLGGLVVLIASKSSFFGASIEVDTSNPTIHAAMEVYKEGEKAGLVKEGTN